MREDGVVLDLLKYYFKTAITKKKKINGLMEGGGSEWVSLNEWSSSGRTENTTSTRWKNKSYLSYFSLKYLNIVKTE